jgi:hypothetical protein
MGVVEMGADRGLMRCAFETRYACGEREAMLTVHGAAPIARRARCILVGVGGTCSSSSSSAAASRSVQSICARDADAGACDQRTCAVAGGSDEETRQEARRV